MAEFIGTEPEGHHIDAYTMGHAVVLRCECGKWERHSRTELGGLQKLADEAAAHLSKIVRAEQNKRPAL